MASQQELTDARNSRFLSLLRPVETDCKRWALSLTRDEHTAADVLSQAILMGLEAVHQLKNDGAFKAWMFRIIVNAFRMQLRSGKRNPEAMDPEVIPLHSPRDDSWVERDDQAKVVHSALSQLSLEQRQAIMLFEMEGLSIREISGVLDKNEGAVRVLLHRARQRLEELLRKAGIDPGETR
jgi:RNA polymerase sigma-70 factor, ECF subfamily